MSTTEMILAAGVGFLIWQSMQKQQQAPVVIREGSGGGSKQGDDGFGFDDVVKIGGVIVDIIDRWMDAPSGDEYAPYDNWYV